MQILQQLLCTSLLQLNATLRLLSYVGYCLQEVDYKLLLLILWLQLLQLPLLGCQHTHQLRHCICLQ
jgi:hypothetical protein